MITYSCIEFTIAIKQKIYVTEKMWLLFKNLLPFVFTSVGIWVIKLFSQKLVPSWYNIKSILLKIVKRIMNDKKTKLF